MNNKNGVYSTAVTWGKAGAVVWRFRLNGVVNYIDCPTKEQAQKAYIAALIQSDKRYKELLKGIPFERQVRIVFGI